MRAAVASLMMCMVGQQGVSVRIASLSEKGIWILCILGQTPEGQWLERHFIREESARSALSMAEALAHEIRNPLSGIRGAAQLLESKVSLEEDKALLHLICVESDRIVRLIDRMGTGMALRPEDMTLVNIHEILEHVCRIVRSEARNNIVISENYDPSLPCITGCPDALTQVFLNLLRNAVQACPDEGGAILVPRRYPGGIKFRRPLTGEASEFSPLEVIVQDNGEGVSDPLSEHISDPFVTNRGQGRGLGLSILHQIIGHHGGMIDFESRPGYTQFRVVLPIVISS